ncbi:YIP1 family protein [Halomarina halobia]|uniref:YIP1 family protein n=1 Tax=Halomarina halobia TaxID=3033386 RepID=A0ABD6A3Q5_9EURY|nr:YIP1 family protein [Halomarina sp. PSR21]
MTKWVESTEGGRERGPVGLVRAWVAVLIAPRRFFERGVVPGDQAPGLVFAVAVALCHLAVRFALDPAAVPTIAGRPTASLVFFLLVAALIGAPLALHLTAAVQTLLLAAFVPARAGISQTVQVIAYATAPCALSGAPIPALRLAAAAYGVVLLVRGMAVVHDISVPRSALVTALPALLVFGFGYQGVAAIEALAGVDLVGPAEPVTNATNATNVTDGTNVANGIEG